MSLFFAAFGLMGFAKMGALIKHTVSGGGTPVPGTPTYYIYGF